MTNKADKTLEMLSAALEMERKGKEFYEKAVQASRNKLGKDIFAKLRDDEIVHQDRILGIYESMKGGKPWGESWKTLKAAAGSLNTLFKDLAAGEGSNITAETTDIEALDVGIALETKSIEFYRDHLKNAADPVEREFLERMIEEEKSHHELLVDMKYYFTDPAGWFAEKEKIHIDGA